MKQNLKQVSVRSSPAPTTIPVANVNHTLPQLQQQQKGLGNKPLTIGKSAVVQQVMGPNGSVQHVAIQFVPQGNTNLTCIHSLTLHQLNFIKIAFY